jgi:hypothetical protein
VAWEIVKFKDWQESKLSIEQATLSAVLTIFPAEELLLRIIKILF